MKVNGRRREEQGQQEEVKLDVSLEQIALSDDQKV